MTKNDRNQDQRALKPSVEASQGFHLPSAIQFAVDPSSPFRRIDLAVVGWREWVSLPSLGIEHLEAKIDTGARSSSLDARHIELFKRERSEWLRFQMYTDADLSRNGEWVEAPLVGYRDVRSSNGHLTRRPVIRSTIQIGAAIWSIELTLCNRKSMGYKILLGRSAIDGRFLVDSSQSFLFKR